LNRILSLLIILTCFAFYNCNFNSASIKGTTWTSGIISDGNYQSKQIITFEDDSLSMIVESLDGIELDKVSYPYTINGNTINIEGSTGTIKGHTIKFGDIVFTKNKK